MANNQTSKVLQPLRAGILLRDGAGLTDGQLVQEYIHRRDQAALAALVRRHGSMVWGVCRRVLRNYHDAEDAFQATFLVFVRKVASIASPELLANWLYGVAHQTALKARATTAKRRAHERQVIHMPERAATTHKLRDDLEALLDQEVSRLPDKYRAAIVLCDLEGKTRKEAARHLGVPEGTLAARLVRGRRMLVLRLARQGLAISSASLAAVLAQNMALASVPASVVGSTIKAAGVFAAGQAAAAGGASVQAIALTNGVLKTMFHSKLKIATAVLLGAGLLGIGWGIYPTTAAAPLQGKQATARSTEFPKSAKERDKPTRDVRGEKKVNLPMGPPPVQVLVSLGKDGKLVVKTESIAMGLGAAALPPLPAGGIPAPLPGGAVPPRPPGGGMPGILPIGGIGGGFKPTPPGPKESSYDLKDVRVLDTRGKKISTKELAKVLKEETVAVASFGGFPLDPLHLRILKEGTIVFLLPLPPGGLGLPMPIGGKAMPGMIGPMPPLLL
jgi:RNA polymerase sigma factor (sigma-70 family)